MSIDSLALGWRDGLTVELRGLGVANAAWSETPRMITVERASVRIDPVSLLGETLRYDRLELRGLRVVLERDPQGVGNWQFGSGPSGAGGGAVVPKDRTQFPTLIDAVLEDGLVTYRTSSGAVLEIDLDEVRIASPDDDRPVEVEAAGAYNGVAARLTGTTEPFAALRDADHPFGLALTVAADSTTARFDGTLMRPLDFDGADGQLSIDASDTTELDRMFRADIGVAVPLAIAGHMTRQGDDWRLAGAEGVVAGNPFAGALRLREAGRGEPDDVVVALDFARFDLAPFLTGGEAATVGYAAIPLSFADPPGINIEADLTAATFVHQGTRLADAALAGRIAGGRIAVDSLGFAVAGGRVTASGASDAAGSGARVDLDAEFESIDAAELAQALGAAPGDVSGRIDGRAAIAMSGTTVADALPTARGHAVVAMNEGRVARSILEKAATDVRALFRDRGGSARIVCVLGVLDLENGVGRLPVLELRTTEATLNGMGTVDLARQQIDLTFVTAPESTGFFALDVPFRVHGRLTSPKVEPRLGGGPRPGEFPVARRIQELPPTMRRMIEGSTCAG